LKQQLVAFEIDFGVLALGSVLGKLAFGLFELNLEWTRIDLGKEIALFYILALLEGKVD
jgi:hypothetical protein